MEGRRLLIPKVDGASQELFLDREVVGVPEVEAEWPLEIVGLELPDDPLVVDLLPLLIVGFPIIISSFNGT